MKIDMKYLLEELYKIEPGLREKEEHLEKVVTHMIALKPEVNVPENFKKVLERRLISGTAPGKERRMHMKNRHFRVFWYILGAGMLASFAVSFGFLSTLGIIGIVNPSVSIPENTPLTTTNNEWAAAPMTMGESTDGQPIAMSESWSLQEERPADKKTMQEKRVLSMKKSVTTVMKESVPTLSPSAVSMMSLDTWIPTSTEKREVLIVYVGEDYIPPPETVSGSTFSSIVSQAQKEANLLIGELERSSYVLKAPRLEYVSGDSSSTKNTVETARAYIFPLKRIDGKESIVQEIRIVVP